MPRFDKTGPDGNGAMTGRKAGLCTGNKIENDDMRSGYGRGRGRFGRRRGGFGFRFRGGEGNNTFNNSNDK